jgi:mRNA-degrading endonuclease YafQ of YafQ-DinJ toxin-antitoxin module
VSERARPFGTLEITRTFLERLISGDFTASDRRRLLRALELLDTNGQHPSLRVHQLEGRLKGVWSASASDDLRISFERLEGGRKLIMACSRHYHR